MTSVLRKYSQIDPRMAYYLVLQDIRAIDTPLWQIIPNQTPSSLMSITEFTTTMAKYTSTNDSSGIIVRVGDLLKDLGRQITVYNSAITGYPHVAVFRQVLYIDQTLAAETEGVGNSVTFYACVWAQEDPSGTTIFKPHYVVRTG